MTERSAGSFLIRVEDSGDGGGAGTVTSVQTGEHVPFRGFAHLARILERWVGSGAPPSGTEETAAFQTNIDEAP